jgi:hypothetical protein
LGLWHRVRVHAGSRRLTVILVSGSFGGSGWRSGCRLGTNPLPRHDGGCHKRRSGRPVFHIAKHGGPTNNKPDGECGNHGAEISAGGFVL